MIKLLFGAQATTAAIEHWPHGPTKLILLFWTCTCVKKISSEILGNATAVST